jgi:hypothetical protein
MSQQTLSGRSANARKPWAMVEIAGAADEKLQTELIRAAYRLSRTGLVALALRGVTRQTVDRALDPVVDVRNEPGMGVVYVDADERSEDVRAFAAHASVVIACTESFRNQLLGYGIKAVRALDDTRGLLALT